MQTCDFVRVCVCVCVCVCGPSFRLSVAPMPRCGLPEQEMLLLRDVTLMFTATLATKTKWSLFISQEE